MDKYIKRIQSRLTSLKITFQGRTVPMWIVRQYYEVLVSDRYSPSEEDLTNVIEAIKAKVQEPVSAAIETEAIAPVTTQAQEPEPEVIIPTPQTFDIPVEDLPCLQPPEDQPQKSSLTVADNSPITQPVTPASITPAEVTQAINQAAQQVGVQGDAEAIQALTSLAQILSNNNRNTSDMVAALVSAYLSERQRIFSSAIGTLNTLRSAQTESFQSGLDEDFFQQREQNKRQFLNKINAMFN